MKHLYTYTALTIFTSLFAVVKAQPVWGIVNDCSSSGNVEIHFFNEMQGYFQEGSTIKFTSDGGDSDTQMNEISGTGYTLSSAYFLNMNDGLAVWTKNDKQETHITSDGGATWTQQSSSDFTSTYSSIGVFSNLKRFDSQMAYSFGKAYRLSDSKNVRRIMITHDAGQTWTMKDAPAELAEVYDVVFLSASTAFCANSMFIYTTTDTGTTWTQSAQLDGQVLDLEFIGADTAYALTDKPKIYKTVDGGTTWTDLNVDINPPGGGFSGKISTFRKASFLNADEGIVACRNNVSEGVIMRTSDGGSTWVHDSLGTDIQAITGSWSMGMVEYVSTNVQFAGGSDKLMRNGTPMVSRVKGHSLSGSMVYPNPGNGYGRVGGSVQSDAGYSVFDLSGRVLIQGKLNNREFDLSALNDGLYQVRIQSGNEIRYFRYLKK